MIKKVSAKDFEIRNVPPFRYKEQLLRGDQEKLERLLVALEMEDYMYTECSEGADHRHLVRFECHVLQAAKETAAAEKFDLTALGQTIAEQGASALRIYMECETGAVEIFKKFIMSLQVHELLKALEYYCGLAPRDASIALDAAGGTLKFIHDNKPDSFQLFDLRRRLELFHSPYSRGWPFAEKECAAVLKTYFEVLQQQAREGKFLNLGDKRLMAAKQDLSKYIQYRSYV